MIEEIVRQIIRGPDDTTPALSADDYCDYCGRTALTKAVVRVKLQSGRFLDFCRHHYLKHEPALAAQGASVAHVTPGPLGENI